MESVRRHYDEHPYPNRDPADEADRLVEGSPSHLLEIDHHLFGGRRDWSAPFRALVAGAGTGDALIMLAQQLADLGAPAEIVAIDLSAAALDVARARADVRGLDTIDFVVGDLSLAASLGPFDYVDCCGVLHHLPDPDAGLASLVAALAPHGGLGVMVYAPLGRVGVYPLQAALRTLVGSEPVDRQLRVARDLIDALGDAHPFRRNPVLGDHTLGDAELRDLLLHPIDRAYSVTDLAGLLTDAGLEIVSFAEPARYEPGRYLNDVELGDRIADLDLVDRAALAERLHGSMKTHVAYVARPGAVVGRGVPAGHDAVPHLRIPAAVAAALVAAGEPLAFTIDGHRHRVVLPPQAAPVLRAIDGARCLAEIAEATGAGWDELSSWWPVVERELCGFNLMLYSARGRS